MIAAPDSIALLAPQTISPSTMSPSASGVCMIASHVRCTCIREKPEYIDSKLADIITLDPTVPAARNAIYDTPSTWPSIMPSPKPSPNR